MKICVVSDHFSSAPGGQHRIQNLSKGFERLGHKVIYASPYGVSDKISDLYIKKEVFLTRLPVSSVIRAYYADFFRIFKRLEAIREKPDLLLIGLPNTMMKSLNGIYGLTKEVPVAYDFGGLWTSILDKGRTYLPVNRLPLRFIAQLFEDVVSLISAGLPDVITVPTTGMKILLEKFLKRTVHVIHHPIDTREIFNPSLVNRAEALEKVPKRYRHKRLVALGVKGDVWFVPFIEKLVYEDEVRDVAFIIMGHFPKAEAMCAKKGLDEHVYFPGNIPYFLVPQYIALTDFAIIPTHPDLASIWYSLHNISKIGDYMAMGKAVITDTLAFDYIDDGQSGFIVRNYDEMVEKTVTLLQDSELALKMGEHARKTACEKFDFINVASLYIELLSKKSS